MTDVRIVQGTDSAHAWPIYNKDKTPFDLTGYKARSQIRSRSNELLYTWTTELGNLVVSGNTIYMLWTHDITSNWRWSIAKYDLEMVSPTGSVTRVDSGSILVSKEVTI
jgi:hypothetical protein